MIGGKGVETGLYVGEVLPEKNSHIGIKASAIRHGRIGMRVLLSGRTVLSPRLLREPAHGETVSDIPGDARQLTCAVGGAGDEAGQGIAHRIASNPFPVQLMPDAEVGSISYMTRTSPGRVQGYLSLPRYFFARVSMWASAFCSATRLTRPRTWT